MSTDRQHLPVYVPEPVTTMTTTTDTTTPNVLRRRSAPLAKQPAVSSVPSSSRWRACALWLARTAGWVSRRRYELAPVASTGTLTALGLAQGDAAAWHGVDFTPFIYSLLAIGSGAAGVLGLKHKNQLVTHVGAAGFVALADITTAVAAGPSWPTATAFALTTGAAYGVYGPWLAEQRNKRIKLNVDTVKARGAVPAAMGLEAADPGLIGATAEETALRRAIHALTGATPQDIPAFTLTPGGGFVALVRMPAGKNTGPEALIKKRAQLATNLGLPGTLDLRRGDDSNELVVRLTVGDALAGTIPYSDDGGTSVADPVRLGVDEYGAAVEVMLLYRHTLIAGASDWGKSGLINLIIKRLARRGDVDLYGIDMKPGSVELGPWRPLMQRIATGIEEAHDLLDWVRAECDRRGKILADLSARELAARRPPVRKWVPGVHGNAIVVVTDELAELVRQDEVLRKEEAELRKINARAPRDERAEDEPPRTPAPDKYESLLAIARSNAIMFVSATQQPSRKVFGGNTDARGNYLNRICTRTGEPGHSPFIFGQGCQSRGWRPEELDLPGKFLLATPECPDSDPPECRAEYVSDEDIAADVGHLHARAVRMAQATSPAAEPPTLRKAPAPPPLYYPDGTPVRGDEWPDLYRAFTRMGSATKDELTAAGPYGSRDTVRRALDVWAAHGVQSRPDGRSTRYYLPEKDN